MIPHYTPNQTTISQHLYYLQNLDGTLIHLTCAPIDPNFFKTSDLNDAYSILYTWMDSSAKDILYFMGMLCDPSNNYGFSLLKMITDLNNGDAARIRSIVQNEESIHQNRDWSYTFTEIIKHKMDNLNAKRTICLLHAAFIFPQKAAWYKANIDYIAQILQEGVQERKAQLQKKPNKSIIERDSKQSNEHNPQPFSTSQIANEPAIDKNTIEHLEDTIVTQVAPQEEQETIREQLNQAPCFEELANNTVDSIEVSVPGACLSTKPNPIQLSTNTFTALIIEPEHEEVTESSPVINVQKTKKRKKRKVAAVKPTTDALSEIQKSSRSNLTKLQSVRKKYKDGFFCLDANTDSKNLQNILREGLWEYICLLVPKSSQSDKDQRYFRELSSIFITNYHNNLKLEYKERLYSKLIDIGYNILWGNEILSSGSPNIIGWFHFIENAIKVANETIHLVQARK